MQVIKYKGQLFRRVDASSAVVEKLQQIIEKRLNSAVDLLHVRGLKFYLKKEKVSENYVVFYVEVDLKSTNNAADLTSKQKYQIINQLEDLLLKGLRPLASMGMFKEHELSIDCYASHSNKIRVCSINPDASKTFSGVDKHQEASETKLYNQFTACSDSLKVLHRAIADLATGENAFEGSFEKNIGEVSAIAPKLANELKHTFSVLTKSAKSISDKLEKAHSIAENHRFGELNAIKEGVKQLQAL